MECRWGICCRMGVDTAWAFRFGFFGGLVSDCWWSIVLLFRRFDSFWPFVLVVSYISLTGVKRRCGIRCRIGVDSGWAFRFGDFSSKVSDCFWSVVLLFQRCIVRDSTTDKRLPDTPTHKRKERAEARDRAKPSQTRKSHNFELSSTISTLFLTLQSSL